MILQVRVGDLSATVDTDRTDVDLTPECAADYLARCADATLRLYAGLPESTEQG